MRSFVAKAASAWLVVILAAFLLLGCGQDARIEKFNQVKPGWSKEQVEQLLGKPDSLQNTGLGLAEVWEYRVTDWKGTVVSTFTVAMIGGRVITGSLKTGQDK
jgi:hypothetical protein